MPLQSNWREQGNAVARIIARTWSDDSVRERFIADPVPFLNEAGIEIPEGIEVVVDPSLDLAWKIEPNADVTRVTYTIGLPARPADLSEDDLSRAIETSVDAALTPCYCCV